MTGVAPLMEWRHTFAELSDRPLKFVNRPALLNLLGRMGIRAPLWRLYCRLFGPDGGIIQLELNGRRARFYAATDWVADELKSFGGEKELLSRLVAMMKPGDVVFDVGANMGLHAVFLGQAVGPEGRIIAFEPEPHYCERLRSNVSLNGLANVRVAPVALGDHSGASELLPAERNIASPRLSEPAPAEPLSPGSMRVEVVEGDKLLETEKLPAPRLVKVDVEGFEVAVLRGLKRTLANPACRIVCCEVHPKLLPAGTVPEEVAGILKSCGFTRIDIQPRRAEQHVMAIKEP